VFGTASDYQIQESCNIQGERAMTVIDCGPTETESWSVNGDVRIMQDISQYRISFPLTWQLSAVQLLVVLESVHQYMSSLELVGFLWF